MNLFYLMAFPGIGQYVNTNPCDWESVQPSTMDDKDKTLFEPAEADLELTRTLVEEEVSKGGLQNFKDFSDAQDAVANFGSQLLLGDMN